MQAGPGSGAVRLIIDPIAFSIGPLAIRWYGISWAVSFLWLLYFPLATVSSVPNMKGYWQDIVCVTCLFVLVGSRIGDELFFQPEILLTNPIQIFAFWSGGLSFHGGLLFAYISLRYCCRKYKIDQWLLLDFVVLHIPPCLGLVRIANFINGE